MIASILLAASLALGNLSDECPMKPASLDDTYVELLRNAKSAVISEDKHVITTLMKNGDALRVLSMGCQHSTLTARLWMQNQGAPSEASLKETFGKMAKLFLSKSEADNFIHWLATAHPSENSGSSNIVFMGQDTSRLVFFEAIFRPGDFGATLDISYEYQ